MKITDDDYLILVRPILDHEVFSTVEMMPHHGGNRLIHSMRVSYYSYKLSKKLGLDYKASAIAGLLHDFYTINDPKSFFKYLKFQNTHPKLARDNSKKYFNVTDKEANMIVTHMFPFTKPSKYIEGWVISIIDKGIAIYEYTIKFKKQITNKVSSVKHLRRAKKR